jgi:hypothetical protein
MDESVNVLAFVRGRKITACLTMLRHWAFAPSLVGRPIARDDAVFLVQEHEPGYFTVLPREEQVTQP